MLLLINQSKILNHNLKSNFFFVLPERTIFLEKLHNYTINTSVYVNIFEYKLIFGIFFFFLLQNVVKIALNITTSVTSGFSNCWRINKGNLREKQKFVVNYNILFFLYGLWKTELHDSGDGIIITCNIIIILFGIAGIFVALQLTHSPRNNRIGGGGGEKRVLSDMICVQCSVCIWNLYILV